MKFDVIVPCYGQPDKTITFLESFALYRLPDMRLILVDNGSPSSELEVVLDRMHSLGIPHLTVLLSENTGFIRGTNAGLAVSTAPAVVLQNNDTSIFRDTYPRLLDALLASDRHGIAGPISSPGTSLQSISQMRSVDPILNALHGDPLPDNPSDISSTLSSRLGSIFISRKMVAFFCTMIRRVVLDKVGFLDPIYGMGLGDDDDYCERARREGFEVVLACGSYVHHDHRSTFKAIYSQADIAAMKKRAIHVYTAKFGKDPR